MRARGEWRSGSTVHGAPSVTTPGTSGTPRFDSTCMVYYHASLRGNLTENTVIVSDTNIKLLILKHTVVILRTWNRLTTQTTTLEIVRRSEFVLLTAFVVPEI